MTKSQIRRVKTPPRKRPKPPKVGYSIRIDGELNELMRATIAVLSEVRETPVTVTDLINAILYDAYFDKIKPREGREVLSHLNSIVDNLPITRLFADEFFNVSDEELEILQNRLRNKIIKK
jgi:hypothetical protein